MPTELIGEVLVIKALYLVTGPTKTAKWISAISAVYMCCTMKAMSYFMRARLDTATSDYMIVFALTGLIISARDGLAFLGLE